MLPWEEKTGVIEERVDGLEAILGQFMAQTGAAIIRLDRTVERMEKAMAEDRREWNERFEQNQREWNGRFEQSRLEWNERLEDNQKEWNRRFVDNQKAWNKRFVDNQKAWNKRWGDLANKMGTLVEDIVAPNIPRIARDYFDFDGLDDFAVRRTVRSKKDRSRNREFDVIAVEGDKVVISETTSPARIDHVNKFLTALEELDEFLPEYKGKTIIPIYASLYMDESVVKYLTTHNIYAMAMGRATMELLNFEQVSVPGSLVEE